MSNIKKIKDALKRCNTLKQSFQQNILTEEKAIEIAQEHDLELEIRELILDGFTPKSALKEWNILPKEYAD